MWSIVETGPIDEASIDRLGSAFLAGNGSLGLRGTLDEFDKNQKTAVIVNGLYDRVGSKWREPVNAPSALAFRFFCEGELLTTLSARIRTHSQSLDFRHGVQERQTDFETNTGTIVRLASKRFVSAVEERLIAVELKMESDRPVTLKVVTGIDGDVWDLNGPHLSDFQGVSNENLLTLRCKTSEKGEAITVFDLVDFNSERRSLQIEGNSIFRELFIPLLPGKPVSLRKYIVVWNGRLGGDDKGLSICRAAAEKGFEHLLNLHCSTWDSRWNECDVEISGDDPAQQALRFSLYHLLAIAPFGSKNLSIPARGLSGQVYKGAIFWDTEIFMLPFFANSFPEVAKKLLLYRVDTLDGARRKAAETGNVGAFYAWESQDTGDDACTFFNVTDVFTGRPIRTFFRDRQIHISADVVFAIWEFFRSSGDDSILLEGGAEVIYEVAQFFSSWLYYKPRKDRYEILDVTGPDEYHERVDNNFFTNLMVWQSFRYCLEMDDFLRETHTKKRSEFLKKTGFEIGLKNLPDYFRKLYVPQPESDSKIVPQFDGFLELEDITLKKLLAKKLHPTEYFGGGNGLARWTQIIKQADVILALTLFSEQYEEEILRKNWEYYEPRTEHGSSLSACAYSMLASRVGKPDFAYKYFLKTATVDLTGDSKQYVGDLYIGGTHPAANGGAWLAVFRGFCGIKIAEGFLSINPHLPDSWNAVSLQVRVGNRKIRATIKMREITLCSSNRFTEPLQIEAFGKLHVWNGHEKISISPQEVHYARSHESGDL